MTLLMKAAARRRPKAPPPLQHGDHLTAEQFERRYDAMPELKKAELINGVVFMPSPVSTDDHAVPHFGMITWLGFYQASTLGVQGGDNATLRMTGANRPQPDAFLRILPDYGGQSKTVNKFVQGAPEWLGEISATSASYDLHEKFELFRQQSVREYVVWRVFDKEIDWFILEGKKYKPLALDGDLYKSKVFPGLWLNPRHLIRGELNKIMKVMQQGVATPEHAAFCQRLLTQQSKKS
jgi:hypothetical protein